MLKKFLFVIKKASLLKTVFLNFKCLPIKQAYRLPILIGKNVRIKAISGEIVIDSPIETAMIKIGMDLFFRDDYKRSSIIENYGRLVFKGHALFHTGVIIATGINATLSFGDFFIVGADSILYARESISFGTRVNISWNFQILDTDFHYIKKIDDSTVTSNTKPVEIGDGVWIGNHVSIGKGTILPHGTIVCSTSYVNKRFDIPNCIIGGVPAKALKEGFSRIFDQNEEIALNKQFGLIV